MKNNFLKRSISAITAFMLCFAAVFGGGMTAFAAGEQAKVYIVSFPRSGDELKSADWGHESLEFMNGWVTGSNDYTVTRALNTYEGKACYCIEPGVSQHTGDTYTNWDEDFWDNYPSEYNSTIEPDDIKLLIGRILQYGYTGNISTSWRSQNDGAESLSNLIATQLLIWETVVGERDADFNKVDPGAYNSVLEEISSHPLKSTIMSYYSSIEKSVKNHIKLPSFMARSGGDADRHEMKWDGEKYVLELIDQNNVLNQYTFDSGVRGIEFTVSGNKLTITSSVALTKTIFIWAEKNNAKRMGVITWTDGKIGPNGGLQDVITYAQEVTDPVKGFLKLNVSPPTVEIVKKDAETDKVIAKAGTGFKIRNCQTDEFVVIGGSDTFYTGDDGRIQLDETLKNGNYELIEVQSAYGYLLDSTPVEFTVEGNQSVVTVEKKNYPQKGIIRIRKTGEVFSTISEANGEYSAVYETKALSGAVYRITAAENIVTPDGTVRLAKGATAAEVTTDENGCASAEGLYLGKYCISEIKAPYGMVLNTEVRTVTLEYEGQDVEFTEVSEDFVNNRQRASIILQKTMEQDKSFGIGSSGEVTSVSFGLYAAARITAADGSFIPENALLEIGRCDSNGKLVFSSDIPVGAELYVKEYSTDGHYILNEKSYPVRFDYGNQKQAEVKLYVNGGEAIKNELIRGKICGVKLDEDGSPLSGAVFGLFLSSGEIMRTETDENGRFVFENIPVGKVYICELTAPDGFVLNETIYEETISEISQCIEIEVVNRFVTGKLVITKRDVTDGRLLPNAGFRIKDEQGETIAEGFTDENGIAEFTLRKGKYTYEEFDAPDGYLLDTTPHEFEITEDGQIIKAEMTDEKEPVPVIPQTNDDSKTGLWLGLSATALGGLSSYGIVRFRRRRKKVGKR